MEPTSPFIVYAPLILAIISALGFAVTVGILIFSRVFRLGKFFAEFTALQETVATLQETVADDKTELHQAIADNKAEIDELRQEMRDGFARMDAKIEAGLQELRGYFVAHLEYHANYPGDDD